MSDTMMVAAAKREEALKARVAELEAENKTYQKWGRELETRVAELEAEAKKRVLVSLVVEFKDGTDMATQVPEGGTYHWGNIESAAIHSISLRFEDKKDMSELSAAIFERLKVAEARVAKLEAQLPEGMEHCTIVFKECEKGHGRLTATNWIDHGCRFCREAELERKQCDCGAKE